MSRIALDKEVQVAEHGSDDPRQRVSFAAWLHAWRSFYQALVPYREQGNLLVSPFSAVIQDMGIVIERVNEQFGTDFSPFDHTDETVAAVHEDQGYHAGPTNRRGRLKDKTRADFDRALQEKEKLQQQLTRADRLFTQYVDASSIDPSRL